MALQEQQTRRGNRTDREKERERYRSKTKPKPISAAQSENFLWQLLAFEEEMREEQRDHREIWELFQEAVRDHPAGTYLLMMKQSTNGQRLVQQLKACKGRDRLELAYGAMYQWARSSIYLLMGGEAEGIPKYFKARWEAIVLPGPDRLDRETVEEWLRQLVRLRIKMYETNYYRPGEEAREADELFHRIPKKGRDFSTGSCITGNLALLMLCWHW